MNNANCYEGEVLSGEEPLAQNNSIFDRLKSIATVSEVLRVFGACAVLASMSLFLLEGWNDGNDIQRYFKLLAQTGLLTGAGFALSFILKEYKGARFFFGLSLISVVSSFTILGSLIYSLYQLDGQLVQYPAALTWQALSPGTFWPICAGAIVLLTLLTRFSFSIFARNIAAGLTINFLLMNSLLLVPVRSSLSISVLAAFAFWVSTILVKRLSKHESIRFTNETKFALGLIFLPGVIIIARALSLYHVDEVLLITLSSFAYYALRALLTNFDLASVGRRLIEVAQIGLGINIAVQLTGLIPSWMHNQEMVVFSIIVMGFVFDQIKHAADNRWKTLLLNFTTCSLVICNLAIAVLSSDLIFQLGSLAIAMLLLLFASRVRQTGLETGFSKRTAILGATLSLILIVLELISLAQLSSWMIIGLSGMVLIIGASVYERFGISLMPTDD